MARSLPTTIVQAVNADRTGELFLALLTVTHSAFSTVRLVNDTQDVTSGGDVYTKFPFAVVLPSDSEELRPRLQVAVQNASRILIDEMRTIAGSRELAKVDLEVIARSDPDTILASWTDFDLVNLEYNADVMQFDLVIENFATEPFPGDSFSPANFPGIF